MIQNCNFCHGLKVKVSSYIAQYTIFGIAQGAFYTLLPGRHVQTKTISASLSFSHVAISRRLLVRKYLSLFIARYSFIQMSELEQCSVKKLAQGFTWQHRI